MRYYSPKRLATLVSVVGIASNAALAISVPFVKSSKAASGDDEFQFQNNQDTIYIGTVKVLGKDFEVLCISTKFSETYDALLLTKT